jgi:hypothetical protein
MYEKRGRRGIRPNCNSINSINKVAVEKWVVNVFNDFCDRRILIDLREYRCTREFWRKFAIGGVWNSGFDQSELRDTHSRYRTLSLVVTLCNRWIFERSSSLALLLLILSLWSGSGMELLWVISRYFMFSGCSDNMFDRK